MPENDLPLHQRLNRLLAIGLTQAAIASEIGVAQPTVCAQLKPPRPEAKLRTSARFMDGLRKLEAKYAVALANLKLAA